MEFQKTGLWELEKYLFGLINMAVEVDQLQRFIIKQQLLKQAFPVLPGIYMMELVLLA